MGIFRPGYEPSWIFRWREKGVDRQVPKARYASPDVRIRCLEQLSNCLGAFLRRSDGPGPVCLPLSTMMPESGYLVAGHRCVISLACTGERHSPEILRCCLSPGPSRSSVVGHRVAGDALAWAVLASVGCCRLRLVPYAALYGLSLLLVEVAVDVAVLYVVLVSQNRER